MNIAQRETQCPNCGGPIEFKLGSAAACVCPWCRHSVVRQGLALEDIGQVAELVPTAAVMAVGDAGTITDSSGNAQEFVVGGRLQLEHGKGPWDEWYIELTHSRQWGWMAQAQGKWYLTFPVEAQGLPTFDQMALGGQGVIPGGGDVTWTVAERGDSELLSAEGELPSPARPGERGRFVDLVGPSGAFATIDYGDGSGAPVFYVGHEMPGQSVKVTSRGIGPDAGIDTSSKAKRLDCPSCGAPVPVLMPDSTERAACQSCNALLDYSGGNLEYLQQLQQQQVVPLIPLGTEGTLKGIPHIVAGFMERYTVADGITYAWREYLMHTPEGFRWLLEDSGHWTYLVPISAGDVQMDGGGTDYQGKKYKLFASTQATVRFVIGEFYWKVQVGEQTMATDFIAPPHILSEERNSREVVWSHGEFLPGDELWQGMKLPGTPPTPNGVSPTEPNTISVKFSALFALATVALLAVIFLLMQDYSDPQTLVTGPITMPAMPDATMSARGNGTPGTAANGIVGPGGATSFTPPFALPSGVSAVEIEMQAQLGQGWVGMACALINETTGVITEFQIEEDRFHATSTAATLHSSRVSIGSLTPGQHVLRLDPRWATKVAPASLPPTVTMTVRTKPKDSSNACCCCGFGVILFFPFFFNFIRRRGFETRRWSNSNMA